MDAVAVSGAVVMWLLRAIWILTMRLVIPVFSQILVLSFVNYGYFLT